MSGERNSPRTAGQWFGEHRALLFTLVYAQISSMGVMYMWGLFHGFGINILEFADVSDFLLSGVKEPLALTLAVVGGALIYVCIVLETSVREAGLRSELVRKLGVIARISEVFARKRIAIPLYLCTYLFYFWLIPLQFGTMHAHRVRNGEAPGVVVALTGGSDPTSSASLEGQIVLIGTTGKFAFFYERETEQTHIIPIANILHISSLSGGSAEGPATSASSPTKAPR